jgi:hypothetical protein
MFRYGRRLCCSLDCESTNGSVNQSSRMLGLSFAFDAFLNSERVQDVQRKFAHEIVATSNCRLRQDAVCAALPNIVLPGSAFPRFERLPAPALAAL